MNTRPVVAMAMCLLASLMFGARLVYADAAPKWTDAELVGFSDLIVRGTVRQVSIGRDDRIGALYTYVTLDVADVFKGPALDRRIVLKQLGGRIGSTALQIAGQPIFTVGEDVVVFLEVRPRDRTLTTTAQWQGKFTIVSGQDGGALAMREDPGLPRRGVFGSETRVANTWIADLRSMIRQLAVSVGARTLTVTPSEVASSTATIMDERSIAATWGDARRAVRVDTAAPGQPALGAEGGERELARAAQFWTNTGLIAFDTGGLQPSGCFIAPEADGRVTVGIDSCGELNPQGGTIAISGRWTRDEDGAPGALAARIVGAGVITNAGANASRLLGRSACFEEIATHELGHVLGMVHSESHSAPMRAFLQCDRGFGKPDMPEAAPRLQVSGQMPVDAAAADRPMIIPLQATAAATGASRGVVRVNVASDGTQANRFSSAPALSSDGRFVAFSSDATNLVPGDTNGFGDVFVQDRLTGVTTRESVGAGGQANGSCLAPSISTDGRFVAFISRATNLVPGVTGLQVYVRDRQLGLTTVASVSSAGSPGNIDVGAYALSANGQFVSFQSFATNLVPGDTNSVVDVFTRDLTTGLTTRDSVAPDGTQSTSSSFSPAISGDGRYVAFESGANNLVPGVPAAAFAPWVFVRDRSTGKTTLGSIGPSGEMLTTFYPPSLSADGGVVAFTPYLGGLLVRDRQNSQTISLLPSSVGDSPPRISADGRFVSYPRSYTNVQYAEVFDRSSGQVITVSPGRLTTPVGGNVVAFVSSMPLVSGDTNGTDDIFIAPIAALPGAPDPPTNLTFTLIGSTLTLTWAASSSGSSATEYVIEAGTLSHSTDVANFSTVATDTSFSATVTIPRTFFIRVRAANAVGVSLPSNEVVLAPLALPGAPGALTASVASGTVTLLWSPASGTIVSYILEAGSTSGRSDLANFNIGSTATTFTATNVPAGTYFARVRAASLGGVGPASNEVSFVVTGGCSAPGPPTALTRSVAGSTATLTWTAGPGATSYILEAGSAAGAANIVMTDLSSPATSITMSGVPAGTYFVRVRSKNACGQSGVSNEVVVIVANSP